MASIETFLPYRLVDYEEAAYLLSKYFIERKYEADVRKSKEYEGGYCAEISRLGLLKNFLGSRTVTIVTFYPKKSSINKNEDIAKIENDKDLIENNIHDTKKENNIIDHDIKKDSSITDSVSDIKTLSDLPDNNMSAESISVTNQEKLIDGTMIQIESGIIKDGVVKEILTYLLVLPALRKLNDYFLIINTAKTRSILICEKLKLVELEGN